MVFSQEKSICYEIFQLVMKSFNILRQKKFWNYKTDFVVKKMVFSQEKSICYEMFKDLAEC